MKEGTLTTPIACAVLCAALAGACTLVSDSDPPPCNTPDCIVDGPEVECDIQDEVPKNLLHTCFAEIADGRIAPNLRTFEPQYSMFTGDIDKRRWIYLPPGSTVDTSDVDEWAFPKGTIFWQEYAAGDRIETQMLEKNGDGVGRGAWRASVYLWTVDQTDAHRDRETGESYAIDSLTDYSEPDVTACMDCHQAPSDVVLGFAAMQLSDTTRAGGIDSWGDYLADSGGTAPAPVELVGDDRDKRMLGQMHADCGTCHHPRGIVAGLGLEMNYSAATTTDLFTTNVMTTGLYKDLRVMPTNVGGSNVYAFLSSGTMAPDRRTAAIDTGFVTELGEWIRDLEGPTTLMVDTLPLTVDGGTAQGREWSGYDITTSDAIAGEVFTREDPYSFRSRVAVPVDTSLTYRVSGQFRSTGVTPSVFYFGLAPYDDNGVFISAQRANRRGTATTIVRSATSATSITTTLPVDDWTQPDTTAGHQRLVGIYYDGDTTKLPDYVLEHTPNWASIGPEFGSYSAAVGTTVTLNAPLPEDVLANMTDATVVWNHYAGATYHYTAASFATIAPDWTEFSGQITGETFSAGAATFRPETAYVKLIILANYQQQGMGAAMLWDDLTIEVVPAP